MRGRARALELESRVGDETKPTGKGNERWMERRVFRSTRLLESSQQIVSTDYSVGQRLFRRRLKIGTPLRDACPSPAPPVRRESAPVFSSDEILERNDLFPSEDVEVFVATEVTVRGGGLVTLFTAALEVERLAHHTRAEVERLLDLFEASASGILPSVRVDVDGQRLGDTDGVGDLEQGATGETRGDDGLGRLAGDVRAGAVDLGRVLSGEGAAAVGAPATVGVDDNLTTGQTGVTVRTTDDKSSGRVQVEDGVGVEVLLRDNLDDFVHQIVGDLFVGDAFDVLGGDQDGVDALGTMAPFSFSYSMVTCVLPSGSTHGHVPSLRTTVRRCPNLVAKTRSASSCINSGVSSVA